MDDEFSAADVVDVSKLWGWMKKNIVGATMLFTALLWVPAATLMCHRDRVKVRSLQDEHVRNHIQRSAFKLKEDTRRAPRQNGNRVAPAEAGTRPARSGRTSVTVLRRLSALLPTSRAAGRIPEAQPS